MGDVAYQWRRRSVQEHRGVGGVWVQKMMLWRALLWQQCAGHWPPQAPLQRRLQRELQLRISG